MSDLFKSFNETNNEWPNESIDHITDSVESVDTVESADSLDTATIVSIGSSCVILISGMVAVICLILYMKRTESRFHSNRICEKCSQRNASSQAIGQTQTRPPTETKAMAANPYAISCFSDDRKTFSGLIVAHAHHTEMQSSSVPIVVSVQSTQPQPGCEYKQLTGNYSQCSSNQDELCRAFEWGQHTRRQHDVRSAVMNDGVFPLDDMDSDDTDTNYATIDTPTDPGIRQFTKSPPTKGERRQGVVFHSVKESESSSESEMTSVKGQVIDPHERFFAIPRDRSRNPNWKVSTSAATLKLGQNCEEFKCFGLSSDEDLNDLTTDLTTNDDKVKEMSEVFELNVCQKSVNQRIDC